MNQLISRTRGAVGLAPGEERGAAGASGLERAFANGMVW